RPFGSTRSGARVMVPQGLDAVVRRALAKKRESRWVDMAAFAAALAPYAGPEGAAYAARAARILRGEARGAAATPFTASGAYAVPELGSETQMQTEVQDRRSVRPRRPRAIAGLGVALAVVVIGVAVSVANVVSSRAPKVETPAMRGIAAACAVR